MRNHSRTPVKYKWRKVKNKVFIVKTKIMKSSPQKFWRQLVLSAKTSSISTEQESTEPHVDHWRAEKSVTTRAYYTSRLAQIFPNYKGSRRRLMSSQDARKINHKIEDSIRKTREDEREASQLERPRGHPTWTDSAIYSWNGYPPHQVGSHRSTKENIIRFFE